MLSKSELIGVLGEDFYDDCAYHAINECFAQFLLDEFSCELVGVGSASSDQLKVAVWGAPIPFAGLVASMKFDFENLCDIRGGEQFVDAVADRFLDEDWHQGGWRDFCVDDSLEDRRRFVGRVYFDSNVWPALSSGVAYDFPSDLDEFDFQDLGMVESVCARAVGDVVISDRKVVASAIAEILLWKISQIEAVVEEAGASFVD